MGGVEGKVECVVNRFNVITYLCTVHEGSVHES